MVPNATVVTVTAANDLDLFFLLKVRVLLSGNHVIILFTIGWRQQLWYRYSVCLEGLPTGCCLGTYALEILVAIIN